MTIVDRVKKILDAVVDILQIFSGILKDVVEAVKELVAIKDVQGAINAIMRLVAIVETVISQIGQAITDILDAVRTTNTGAK